MCGTPKGEGKVSLRNNTFTDNATLPAVSSLKFSETKGNSSREFEAQITDTLGVSLGDSVITSMFTGKVPSTFPSRRSAPQRVLSNQPQQLSLIEGDASGNGKDITIDVVPSVETESVADASRFKHIFREKNGQITLFETRLKAKNKIDAARRLTSLFLLYNADKGRNEVPRAELNEILNSVNLNDGNVRTWLKDAPELVNESSMVGLRQPGIEKAEQALREVLDESVKDKWVLGQHSTTRKSKATTTKADGSLEPIQPKKRRVSKTSADVEEWRGKWKLISDQFSLHNSLKSGDVLKKGRFGLWAIFKATNNPEIVVSRGKLQKFLHLEFGFEVHERSLDKRLKEIAGKGELIKVDGGFKLLGVGAQAIEKELVSKPLDTLGDTTDLWQEQKEA